MAKTILAIEDDTDLCELLEYNLTRSGYEVKILHSLEGALDTIKAIRPDLLILDVMLPDGDGFDFCRALKADPEVWRTPVLFLTARSQEIDRVLGLEIGGDDYVTKPFSPRELLARVKVHLRRTGADRPVDKPTEAGPLALDKVSRRVFLNGKALALTATEFKLLEFFLAHPGRVYSREQLLNSIWGEDCHVTPRNVDVHIRRLRERIEKQPDSPQWLQTVRGFGYRFEVPA
jgi:two-component system, OmpR family, alkaline phosphatase synthesis response regulator PhoP